jgi:predicted RNA-binding protein with PIN domain
VRDHLPVHWIVDGNNVMGSRPDAWWRDRARAARGLAAQIAAFAHHTGEPVTLFFDGRPRDLGLPCDTPLQTLFADRPGRNAADDAIVEYVEATSDPTTIRVVSSDRELAARVQAAGAQVEGAGRFRARLDAL